jgi:hypothetical protein
MTRSGRVIQLPSRFREELDNFLFEEEQEKSKNDNLIEMLCNGAGIGEGILNTGELHVLNHKNAMAGDDRENWKKAIDKEHERIIENKVWITRKLKDLPVNVKLLTTTRAMKKKANRQYRARITAQGFLQEDGIHNFSHSTASPSANELTIKTVLTLLTLVNWKAQVIDVKGAFLKGQFSDEKDLCLRIPQGFENYYNKDNVLQLKQTIYDLKQAALNFWKELLQAFKNMRFRRSSADPCLYVKDTKNGLVIWILWVDDCLLMVHKNKVSKYNAVMNSYFDCDNIGDLKEYVGCKIDKQERGNRLLITQLVIVRSFIDEFGIQEEKKSKYQPQEATHSVQFWT